MPAGALRPKVGCDLGLVENVWKPCGSSTSPCSKKTEGGLAAMHHPFTAPSSLGPAELKANPVGLTPTLYGR